MLQPRIEIDLTGIFKHLICIIFLTFEGSTLYCGTEINESKRKRRHFLAAQVLPACVDTWYLWLSLQLRLLGYVSISFPHMDPKIFAHPYWQHSNLCQINCRQLVNSKFRVLPQLTLIDDLALTGLLQHIQCSFGKMLRVVGR